MSTAGCHEVLLPSRYVGFGIIAPETDCV